MEKEKENKCKGKSLVDRWILKKVYDYMLYVADAWNAVSFLPFPFPLPSLPPSPSTHPLPNQNPKKDTPQPPLLLRPPPLPHPLLPTPTSTHLPLPPPILPQPHLRIPLVIKLNERNLPLNQRPNPPIEPRHPPKRIHLLAQLLQLTLFIRPPPMPTIAIQILAQESAPRAARRQHRIIAVEAAPLGEVVREVERGGCRGGVLVVYEGDGGGSGIGV